MPRQQFDKRNTALRAAHYEEVRWFSAYFPVIETGQALSIAIILGAGGFWLLGGGEAVLSLGALIAFLAYIRDFFRPLGSLSDKAGAFQVAMASAERIFELMDTPETLLDPEHAEPETSLSMAPSLLKRSGLPMTMKTGS